MVSAFERRLDRFGRLLLEWWAWPAFMVLVGGLAVLAALLVHPGTGDLSETMLVGSVPLGGGVECAFRQQWGFGCPSCGMTRSWVYVARGDLLDALRYNAAGATLWIWLAGSMLVGSARLLLRRPAFLAWRWWALGGVGGGWFLFLLLGMWIGRAFGINPLP